MAKRQQQRGMGSVYLRNKIYWIKFYRNGKPIRESSHSEKREDAVRLLKQRQGEIVTGKYAGVGPERITMAALFEMVIQDYKDREHRDIDIVKMRIAKHLMPALGNVRAAEFNSEHVKAYLRERRAAHRKPANATLNRELSIIRRAFHLAMEADPPRVAHLVHIEKLPEDNVRQGFVEHEQYLRLRDELPPYARLALVIGYYWGNRLGEVLSLKWSMADLQAGEVRIPAKLAKQKKSRVLPIYDGEMRLWLEMAKAERDLKWPKCEYMIHENGQRIFSFRKAWKSACERAGLPGLLFHDLRRSAIRNMERAGFRRSVAMQISGHATESVYRRYDIVSERDMQDARTKMQEFTAVEKPQEQIEKRKVN